MQNLERLGIDVRVRTVDTAQYQRRDGRVRLRHDRRRLRPVAVAGQRAARLLGLEGGRHAGQPQHVGINDPAVDELIELVIAAPDRESLIARTRALDRVLLWGHYVDPALAQPHGVRSPTGTGSAGPAGAREVRAGRARHLVGRRRARDSALRGSPASRRKHGPRRGLDDRLHPPPAAADGPDAARHHGHQLRHHPGRARRAGRADDRRSIQGTASDATDAHLAAAAATPAARPAPATASGGAGTYRGARGLDPGAHQASSRSMFGFDKPLHERFFLMMASYLALRLRRQLLPRPPVVDLVIEKMPVSISLGLWTTLLIYLDLDPARHPQGGARRLALRRLDQRRRHRRLRHSRLPVRHAADRAVRRRQLLQWFPLRGLVSDELGRAVAGRRQGRSTISGTWRCRSPRW